MTGDTALLILGSLALLFSGMPVAFALAGIGMVGLVFFLSPPQLDAVGYIAWKTTNDFILTAVPLFIFMGEMLLRSGLSEKVYTSLNRWLLRLPGGLAHTNVASCALFAAIQGTSTGTAATVGTVALPAMAKRRYDRLLTYGSIAAGGTLGILIPPSIPFVIYGQLMGESIGRLFMAGVVPGILMSGLFMACILVWAWWKPDVAPATSEQFSLVAAAKGSVSILPAALLIAAILGGIYAGVVTPTESAAIGATGSVVIAMVETRGNLRVVRDAMLGAARTTSMILLIMIGASVLNYVALFQKIPQLLATMIVKSGVSSFVVLGAILALYLILGMFLDAISMMVMTLPVLQPLLPILGFDPIWFGVLVIMMDQIGLLTPPVGLDIFVVRALDPSARTVEIVLGILPFLLMELVTLALVMMFPEIALWLPRLLG